MSSQITKKTIDGWPLGFRERDHRPLISELDLGAKFRYARPDDAIRLIDRLVAAGKFNESEFLHTPWEKHGGKGRPRKDDNGGMRWLDREQALLAATQSDTPVAWDITREMARVFQRVLDGFFVPIEQLAELQKRCDALEARCKDAELRLGGAQSSTIAEAEQNEILALRDDAAAFMVNNKLSPSLQSARRTITNLAIEPTWDGPISTIPHGQHAAAIKRDLGREKRRAIKEVRRLRRVAKARAEKEAMSRPRVRPNREVPEQRKLWPELH
jgi:hypothetical protein